MCYIYNPYSWIQIYSTYCFRCVVTLQGSLIEVVFLIKLKYINLLTKPSSLVSVRAGLVVGGLLVQTCRVHDWGLLLNNTG